MKADTQGFNLTQCSENYQKASSVILSPKQLCAGDEDGRGNICSGDAGELISFRIKIHQQFNNNVTILGFCTNRWSINRLSCNGRQFVSLFSRRCYTRFTALVCFYFAFFLFLFLCSEKYFTNFWNFPYFNNNNKSSRYYSIYQWHSRISRWVE